MNYHLRGMNGKSAIFFYNGVGAKQKTSFVYKDGNIALFDEEYKAIQIADKIKMGHSDDILEEYKFEPDFLKAVNK